MEEQLGLLLELVGVLGGEIADGVALRTFLFDGGVALEIVLQALRHIFALRDDAHAGGQVLQDFRHEQRVVGAAQDERIDLRVEVHDLVDALLDEVVGAGGVGLVILYQRHPEGAGDAADGDVGEEFLDFQVVALALDGAFGGEDAYVAGLCQRADDLGGRAYDAQDTPLRVPQWQVVLLDTAQGLCRGGVAAEDDEMAAHLEESFDGLSRELVDDVEGTWSVGCTGIIAEVQVVVLG